MNGVGAETLSSASGSLARASGSPRPVELRRLEWDSEFFGTRMGEIVVQKPIRANLAQTFSDELAEDLAKALAVARAEEYSHVILRAEAGDFEPVWAAEHVGMRLVDIGVDSSFRLAEGAIAAADALAVRGATEGETAAIADLAAEAFIYSRFHADPFFSSEQVIAFHRQWATNLCLGLAHAVLIAELGGEIAGFVTCAISGDQGRIPLLTTKEGYRQRGVGSGLVLAALQWFRSQGAKLVNVKTQAHNYPALHLYHRVGFLPARTDLTYSATLR
jgi:ribosomal protein S18 acetylase RimI-like enzyme